MELDRIALKKIALYLEVFPCVALVGPRQVGKTSLALMIQHKLKDKAIYLDLESEEDQAKLLYPEQYFTQRTDKLIILDEIQRRPDLFPLLRSVIDKKRVHGRFLLLGSASPELMLKSSESLAGRIAYVEMSPLLHIETKQMSHFDSLWLKGGFPTSFLQTSTDISLNIRTQFIQTYIERELPLLGLSASPIALKNLLRMVAHSNGQLISYTDYANSLGLDINTIKRYLDYFENAFLIRRLQPYFENSKKRLVKSPKIYIRDTGMLHALYQIETKEDLDGFPGKGNSWEGFVIQQIVARLTSGTNAYFYRTQDGTELDLLLVKGMKPIVGLEIKLTNAPKPSKGTTLAAQDLKIPVWIISPTVQEDYALNKQVTVTSFDRIDAVLKNLKLVE